MSTSFTRSRKRRLNAVQARVDKTIEADAAYFVRFRHRSHRVRLASAAELEANAAMLGLDRMPTESGRRWFTCIRQVEPGVRIRAFITNDDDVDCDLPEPAAAYVFDLAASKGVKKLEESIRTAFAKRGAR